MMLGWIVLLMRMNKILLLFVSGCVVEILSTELVGVLCVLSPVCEVVNSEGRTTSVVCLERLFFASL
jgi:hypothetical protein